MSQIQDFFKPAKSNGLKYQEKFYCRRCGKWIEKLKAVYTFLTKTNIHNPKPILINSKCPRCPECHFKLKTRPTVRKAGRQELEKELVRY